MERNVRSKIDKNNMLKQMEWAYAGVMTSYFEAMDERKSFEENRLVNLVETINESTVLIEPEELTIRIAATEKCMVDFFIIYKGGVNLAPAKDNESFWRKIGFEPNFEDRQGVLESFNQQYSRLADEVRKIINQKQ